MNQATELQSEIARVRDLTLHGIDNIPPELRAVTAWLVYKLVPRKEKNGRVKLGKPPVGPATGKEISWNSPKNFLTFERAISALRANKPGNLAGIGLSLVSTSGLVGIDLDDALNPDGSPLPWASAILERVPSYCEISPSGKGLRLFGRGTLPEDGAKHGDIEAYIHNRFLTLTGQVWGTRGQVQDIPPEVLTWFWKTHIRPPKPEPKPTPPNHGEERIGGTPQTALEIIRLIENCGNATKFKALMKGDISGYNGDNSRAHLGLLCILAFYCRKDPGLMETVFNLSELSKHEKWSRPDYRERTIRKAIEGTKEVFSPSVPFQKEKEIEAPKLKPTSAADLQRMVFKDPKWAVPGILPEGLTILAGRPKKGKSWMALGLALSVASGGIALGKEKVEKGGVLYLALEDSKRRLQNRIFTLLGVGESFPPDLHFITADDPFPRQDWAAMGFVISWIEDNPGTRLIIIDTLAKIQPRRERGGDSYQEDYSFMGKIQSIALAKGIAILMVHHTRKAETEDVFDRISGTTGITGAADATWVIASSPLGKGTAILHMVGRDIDTKDLAMKFENGQWTIEGDAEDLAVSPERRAVIELLRKGTGKYPKQIAEALSLPVNTVYKLLFDMKKAGQISQEGGKGKYYVMFSKDSKDGKDSKDSKDGKDASILTEPYQTLPGAGKDGISSGSAKQANLTVLTNLTDEHG